MSQLKYRLALDLGTTSLGWAMIRLTPAGETCAVIRAGVRIFSDGRNPKDGSSLAVSRREARAARRRRDRLLKRKHRLTQELIKHQFFPVDAAQRKALELLDPYALRFKGLDAALTPGEFARAVFHLSQRRGFASNRRTDRKDSDSGALKTAIAQLRRDLTATNSRTVGEWLWQRLLAGQSVRARYRETPIETAEGKRKIDKRYDLYVERAMVESEFDTLWQAQARLNPAQYQEPARMAIKDALLFQRKLRPVRPGRCTLLPHLPRAALALPSSQRFRIYQEVNHLRVIDDQFHAHELTLAQRNAAVVALESKPKVTFTQLRKLLGLPGTTHFNLEDEKRVDLNGNKTSATLSKKDLFGSRWVELGAELQDEIVQRLVSEENESELVAWLQAATGIDERQAEAIAQTDLTPGFGSLSQEALVRILPHLQAAVVTYDKAVQAAGFEHHSQFNVSPEGEDGVEWVRPQTGEIKRVFKQLPYYGRALQRHVAFGTGALEDPEERRFGKIANPTVHIGLNQVRVVVNALLKKYGTPAEVVVELARDLKQSREQRIEAQKRQAENQRRNDRIRKDIAGVLGLSEERVKTADIQKWILWEELSRDPLDRRCPYSGVQISASMLLSPEVEVEHILPFAMTLDDSLNNKTVALRQANRIKANRTPWQAHQDFEAQGWPVEGMLRRAEQMPRAKRYRFGDQGYQQWLGEDDGFLARALNDTRYLSRIAREYMSLICPQTRVIPGQMTALLRGKFGLNTILGLTGEKNRDDHRHHAVDACVIGVTDQSLLQRFAQASAQAHQQGLTRLVEYMPLPWPRYREAVATAVHAIKVSHKPDHGHEGALMEDTAYGISKAGVIKQKAKADGSAGRQVTNLIRVAEPGQPQRHGLGAEGEPLPYKGYVGGSNYCLEVTRDDQGKWQGRVISTFEAYAIVRRAGLKQLRHPNLGQDGRPLVMRLVIGDSVRMRGDGADVTYRVVKMSAKGQVFFAPLHEANVDNRNTSKSDSFKYVSKYPSTLQKGSARQVGISPIGELRDPGFKG